MAALALGAIGAGVGFEAFGTMAAAQLGFSIFSTAGSFLFPGSSPTQYGPKQTDLKVVSANYGEMVPKVWATERLATKMIWSTKRIEHEHKDTTGGKGAQPSQTTKTYTYTQSMAYLICEGVADGFIQIFVNGALVYNMSSTADIPTQVVSALGAANIQFYPGDETQLPNSTIQADLGVTLTPAYRGCCYLVITDMDVTALPLAFNFEVVVVKSGTYTDAITYTCPRPIDNVTTASGAVSYMPNASKMRGIFGDWDASYLTNNVWIYDLLPNGTPVKITTVPYQIVSSAYILVLTSGNANCICTLYNSNTTNQYTLLTYDETAASLAGLTSPWFVRNFHINGISDNDNLTWFYDQNVLLIADFLASDVYLLPAGAITADIVFSMLSGYTVDGIDCSDNYIYVCCHSGGTGLTKVLKYNKSTYAYIGEVYSYSSGGSTNYSLKVVSDSAIYIAYSGIVEEVSTGAVGKAFSTSPALYFDSAPRPKFNVFGNSLVFYGAIPGTPWQVGSFFVSKTLSNGTVPLSDFVTDISIDCGLTAGDIDVSQLTADTVYGFMLGSVGTGRSAIEAHMPVSQFDAAEIDGKVVFVKRGQSSIVTIPEDDLAAHEYGSAMPDQIYSTRKQEMELPLQVNVTYPDKDNNFLIGSQYARRLTTLSKMIMDVPLAVAISATKGKQVADILLANAWQGRNTHKISLGNKYSYITPTDVFKTSKGNINYTLRGTNRNDAKGIISLDAAAENISVYTQTNAPALMLPAPTTVTLTGDTKCVLMDIPLLRDQDDGIGFYGVACGYASGWSGSDLLKSTDNSAYSSYGNGFFHAAVIGYTNGVLGDWTGGKFFDESNVLSVTVYEGTLSSTTAANIFNNNANTFLIGSEIVQAKNCVLTGTNTYALSGMLRGCHGTDWGQSTHVAGETVVLLDPATINLLSAPSGEYNLPRYYKAVTFGQMITDADAFVFTNTAVSKKCYAPVHLGWGRDAAGNITLQWVRRTRIGGNWVDYSDVPLGETTEAYAIDIYAVGGTTVLRTLTATTNTVNYTAAQQTTDFGFTGAFDFTVQQIGATGRGYAARLTVPDSSTYARFDPTHMGSNITLSGGDMVATSTASGWKTVLVTIGKSSGNPYFELTLTASGGTYQSVGIANSSQNLAAELGNSGFTSSLGYESDSGLVYSGSVVTTYGTGYVAGDVIGIVLNGSTGEMAIRVNNVLKGTTLPGSWPVTGPFFAAVSMNNVGDVWTLNSGATAFTYSVPAGADSGIHS